MFQELWVGLLPQSILRHQLIGWLQRRIIRRLSRQLKPAFIHTITDLYLQTLQQLTRLPTARLPLFGNIPVAPDAQLDSATTRLLDGAIVLLHFSSATPKTGSLRRHLLDLRKQAQLQQKSCIFVQAGRGGVHLEATMAIARDVLGPERAVSLGEVSAEMASALMQRADYGYSRNDHLHWQKSGVVAAMLEHQLPILFNIPESEIIDPAKLGVSHTPDTVATSFLNTLEQYAYN